MSVSDEQFMNELVHYGIKGMKWGTRRRVGSDGKVVKVSTSQKPGKYVKAEGGHNQKASPDAVKAAKLRQKAKKSTTDSLSNQELQALVTRMNLESQYQRLNANDPRVGAGTRFVRDIVNNIGKQQVTKLANDQATKLVAKQLK